MRMAKRRIARRVGFEKCLIPWKELISNSEGELQLIDDVNAFLCGIWYGSE